MRYLRYLFAVLAFIILTTTISKTQVNLNFGVGIGTIIPVSDFSGSMSEFYNGSRYGLSSGPNIHIKAKVGLSVWSFVGEVDYSALQNKGNAELSQGVMEVSQQILSLKVGPELRFSIPTLPITPYIGVNFALNKFIGDITFQGVSQVPSASFVMRDATRFGIGFLTGAEVRIGSSMSLDFNISYNFMNISGKEWEDVNPGINQRVDSYLALNDARDPQYTVGNNKHFISNERNIRSILFTVGILFGF